MSYVLMTDGPFNGRVMKMTGENHEAVYIEDGDVIHAIPKTMVRYMPETFKPGIPEAFDTDGSMYVPKDAMDAIRYTLDNTAWKIAEEAKNTTPDGYLEPWPNPGHPDDVDNDVEKGGNMEATVHQLNVVINSLRKRSAKKGEANARMSREKDMMEKALKEANRDLDGMIEDNNRLKEKIQTMTQEANERDADALALYKKLQQAEVERDEYKRLNEHHRNEVEIGNQRREKMKYTVESLHDQLNAKNKTIAGQSTMIQAMEEENARYKRIIDALTKTSVF
jgi:hypothetical protein